MAQEPTLWSNPTQSAEANTTSELKLVPGREPTILPASAYYGMIKPVWTGQCWHPAYLNWITYDRDGKLNVPELRHCIGLKMRLSSNTSESDCSGPVGEGRNPSEGGNGEEESEDGEWGEDEEDDGEWDEDEEDDGEWDEEEQEEETDEQGHVKEQGQKEEIQYKSLSNANPPFTLSHPGADTIEQSRLPAFGLKKACTKRKRSDSDMDRQLEEFEKRAKLDQVAETTARPELFKVT